jgi:hypothetical protein
MGAASGKTTQRLETAKAMAGPGSKKGAKIEQTLVKAEKAQSDARLGLLGTATVGTIATMPKKK